MIRRNLNILTIGILTGLISYLHFVTMRHLSPRVVFEELYYLPLLFGVIRFGLKGSILTWLFISATYVPFFFGNWVTSFPELVDRYLHLLFTMIFASAAYILAERERKKHKRAQRERYLAGIGQVATVIVHDLKTPLITILGFARRIREGKGDFALGAQTIEKSAQNMQKIIESVLDFAKPLQLERRDIDIRDVIFRAGESCRTKAESKGVTVSMHLPSAQIVTSVDSFHIERALVNLIDNAVDASQSGAMVDISVATNRNTLKITIKDQGAGMDSETLTSLFMPFYTTKKEGTGLGMSISKKVFEAHSATLDIRSKKGVGTEATIRLPCKQENGLGKMNGQG
jgi:two-component system, NtrC family, sensor histidine kinase HydH